MKQQSKLFGKLFNKAHANIEKMNISSAATSPESGNLSSNFSTVTHLDFSHLDPRVILSSPFLLIMVGGSFVSLFLLCAGFVLMCKINRKNNKKPDKFNKNGTRTCIIQREIKLKRSETEKEFQETKLGCDEKHTEHNFDSEKQNMERKIVCRSLGNESSFEKLYNHSFRTFGQKRRQENRRTSVKPAENRYYQQTLEYEEEDSVHF